MTIAAGSPAEASPLFCRVAKYNSAKSVSIQVPGVRENSVAKFATNFFFYSRVNIDKLVRNLICVEKFGGGNDLAQTFAEAGLACGNSASDPDDSHSSED